MVVIKIFTKAAGTRAGLVNWGNGARDVLPTGAYIPRDWSHATISEFVEQSYLPPVGLRG
jgi:hypothetical protein